MPLAFAEMLLQGDAGSMVDMSVLRARKSEAQKIQLMRSALVYGPVTGRVENGVGIVQTVTLAPGRVKDIANKINEVEKQGAKRLILDLRHCSTGPDAEGVALANLFLDKGLIGYTQGQKMPRQDYQASGSRAITKLPLVVITNRGTAGAAEITAAALLDSKRAEVVGEHTFGGDAAIRRAITLDDGSAVLLSVAKYYSPSGKAIQDGGITPSVLQNDSDVAAAEAAEDDLPEGAVAPEKPAAPAAPAPDVILKRALEVVEKATPAQK